MSQRYETLTGFENLYWAFFARPALSCRRLPFHSRLTCIVSGVKVSRNTSAAWATVSQAAFISSKGGVDDLHFARLRFLDC